MANKGIELKKSNLIIIGKGFDSNGNKIVKLKYPNSRAFSIQTNGNLPVTHKALSEVKSYAMIKKVANMDDIENEIIDYITTHGTKTQKSGLKTYFEKGGRPKAALAKDRKYTSEEPHEQAYKSKRKSKVLKYKEVEKKEKGGEIKVGDKVIEKGKPQKVYTVSAKFQKEDGKNAYNVYHKGKWEGFISEDYIEKTSGSTYSNGGEIKVGDFVKYPKAEYVGEVIELKPSSAIKGENEISVLYLDGKVVKDLSSSFVKHKSSGVKSINPKKFTLNDVINSLQDVQVTMIVKGVDTDSAADKEVVWKQGDSAKKHNEWFGKNLTISDYGIIEASKGSENLYAQVLVFMADDINDMQAYTVHLYSKDNVKGLKSLVSHFVTKMEKGGMVDLFEDYEKLPKAARDIYEKYEAKIIEGDYDYKDSKNFLKEMESEGYTFDSGLDNEPYGLRPIGVSLNELEGFEEFAKGGEVSKKKDHLVIDSNDKILFEGTKKECNSFCDTYLEGDCYVVDYWDLSDKKEYTYAKGGEVEGELKGEIIKEVNSKVWTLQLYDDNGYHSSIYAPKKSDLTQYMREQGIKKYAKGGEVRALKALMNDPKLSSAKKRILKKQIELIENSKGGEVDYEKDYANKSLEYISREIAHTERSARAFEREGDYERAADRQKHARKLWEIHGKKKQNQKELGGSLKGSSYFTEGLSFLNW